MGRPSGARQRLFVIGVQGAFVLALLALWDYLTVSERVARILLPPIGGTFRAFFDLAGDVATYQALKITVYTYVVAMLWALASGLVFGLVVGNSRYLSELVEPIIVSLYSVPIIMIYPLCILYFGIGPDSKIAFSAIYAFFPIAIQTIKGLRYIDAGILKAARAMGASGWKMIVKVKIPAAFPTIMTGIRIGGVLGMLSTIAGEMIASVEGVGNQVQRYTQLFRSEYAYSWIMIIIVLVLLLGALINWGDRRLGGNIVN